MYLVSTLDMSERIERICQLEEPLFQKKKKENQKKKKKTRKKGGLKVSDVLFYLFFLFLLFLFKIYLVSYLSAYLDFRDCVFKIWVTKMGVIYISTLIYRHLG